MSIKTKIIILAIFSLVVTATIGLILFQNSLTVKKEIEKQVIISEIRNTIFERAALRDEYFLYPEERPVVQFQALSQPLEKLILQLSNVITLTDEQVSLKTLRDNKDSINQIFLQIIANSSTSTKELEQRLRGQLSIRFQENIAIVAQLSKTSRSRVIESQQRATFFVLIFFAGSTAILILTLSLIWFSIAKPLLALKESALRIASLDFSTTTTTTTTTGSNDEVGQLARAFNTMVLKLKESYAGLERKVAERTEALAEAKAQDEAILFSIGDAVMACDKDGLVMLFNGMAEKLSGFLAKEVVGHHYNQALKFVKESDEKTGDDFIAEAIKTGQGTKMANHTLLITKGGQKIPVADSAAPIKNNQGKIIGCVLVFRDMVKEREIDKAKTEFVSLASHQLRTPLTGIEWTIELFSKKEKLTAQGQKYLADIHFSASRLSALIKLLLNVSRIESGNVGVVPEPLDLVEFINEYMREHLMLCDKGKISFIFAEHPEKLMATTDKNLVGFILQNVMANAIEYTQPGGKVEVLLEEKQNSVFLVTVRDTGVGIPKTEQARIFEKFVRASNAITIKPDGTGLGLYITQESVKLLGGKIWFESVEGKGSTFYVELPMVAQPHGGEKGVVLLNQKDKV